MKKNLLLFLFLWASNISIAQDGQIDPGYAIGDSMVKNGIIRGTAVQSDGKVIAVGDFWQLNGVITNRILRFNQDGTRDTGFDIGSGFDATTRCVTIQTDGKILIGGAFTTYNGSNYNKIIRLNVDGSVDTSFSMGSGFDAEVYAIKVLNDGKILVGGVFGNYNSTTTKCIARLNQNGTIDNSINFGAGALGGVKHIIVQNDGKYVFAGSVYRYNGTDVKYIFRTNTDGSLDNTFQVTTGVNSEIFTIAIQADQKIIASGGFTKYGSNTTVNYIIRYNTNGAADFSFATGSGFNGPGYSSAVQPDGKILIGGLFSTYKGFLENKILRLNQDGTKDTAFNSQSGFNSNVFTITLQSDGKIIAGGEFNFYKGESGSCVTKLNADASRDTSFNTSLFRNNGLLTQCMAKQPDGRIIAAGDFTSSFQNPVGRIIRFNGNGTVDPTFLTGSGANSTIQCLAVQADGKILLCGQFNTFNGIATNKIVRLNSDGTVDTSFNIGTGFDGTGVYSIAVQSDGKILVGGFFSFYNGNTANDIVRLNTNGSYDNTFITFNGLNHAVRSIKIQPDGKIIATGTFWEYYGHYVPGIVRMEQYGGYDASFVPFSNASNSFGVFSIWNTETLSNGKILIVGELGIYGDTTSNSQNLFLLNADGSADLTFNPGFGFDDVVTSVAAQPDGKIVLGGLFTSYNEIANNAKGIIRLNADSSIDETFNTGNGFNFPVYSLITDNESVFVGGRFTEYNGVAANGIVKLKASNQLLVNDADINEFSIYPNPAGNILTIYSRASVPFQSFEIFDILGKTVLAANHFQDEIDVSGLTKGIYILKIKASSRISNIKFIKD